MRYADVACYHGSLDYSPSLLLLWLSYTYGLQERSFFVYIITTRKGIPYVWICTPIANWAGLSSLRSRSRSLHRHTVYSVCRHGCNTSTNYTSKLSILRMILRNRTQRLPPPHNSLPNPRLPRILVLNPMRNLHMPLEQILTDKVLPEKGWTDGTRKRFEPCVTRHVSFAFVLPEEAHTAKK